MFDSSEIVWNHMQNTFANNEEFKKDTKNDSMPFLVAKLLYKR